MCNFGIILKDHLYYKFLKHGTSYNSLICLTKSTEELLLWVNVCFLCPLPAAKHFHEILLWFAKVWSWWGNVYATLIQHKFTSLTGVAVSLRIHLHAL